MTAETPNKFTLSLRISSHFEPEDLDGRFGRHFKSARPGKNGSMNYWCVLLEEWREISSADFSDLLIQWIEELDLKAEVFDEVNQSGGAATLVVGICVGGNLGFIFEPGVLATLVRLNVGFLCETYAPAPPVPFQFQS